MAYTNFSASQTRFQPFSFSVPSEKNWFPFLCVFPVSTHQWLIFSIQTLYSRNTECLQHGWHIISAMLKPEAWTCLQANQGFLTIWFLSLQKICNGKDNDWRYINIDLCFIRSTSVWNYFFKVIPESSHPLNWINQFESDLIMSLCFNMLLKGLMNHHINCDLSMRGAFVRPF